MHLQHIRPKEVGAYIGTQCTQNQHLALWGCFARIHHDQFPPILQKLQAMSSSSSNFVMHLHLTHHDISRHLFSGGVQNPLHPTSNLWTHHDTHPHTHTHTQIYSFQGFSGIQRFKFKIQFCSRQPMCRDRYQGRVFFFAHKFVWQVERCQLSWLLDIHSRQRNLERNLQSHPVFTLSLGLLSTSLTPLFSGICEVRKFY